MVKFCGECGKDVILLAKIWVFHGVNLNLLGTREPEHYGQQTMNDINLKLQEIARKAGIALECRQTNHEGELIDWIHTLTADDFLLLNPGAWTHYSYAIRDAISSVRVPALEIHLSNIHAREEFRKTSVIAPVCIGQISGLGMQSYILGMHYALDFLQK